AVVEVTPQGRLPAKELERLFNQAAQRLGRLRILRLNHERERELGRRFQSKHCPLQAMRHDCTRPTADFPGKTWPDFFERAARVGCRQQKNLRSGIAGGSESSGNLRSRCCLSAAHALEGSP